MKFEVFFCPFCRVVSKVPSQFKPRDKNNFFDYQCFSCQEYFNTNTYDDQSRNGQNYHFDDEGDANQYIQSLIINFYIKGYSGRKIHEITHFSRDKISKLIKEKKQIKVLTHLEFFTDHLKVDENTLYSDAINFALDYGCSKRQVRELFNTSYRKMDKVLRKKNNSNKVKHRIKIDGDIIYYYYF